MRDSTDFMTSGLRQRSCVSGHTPMLASVAAMTARSSALVAMASAWKSMCAVSVGSAEAG